MDNATVRAKGAKITLYWRGRRFKLIWSRMLQVGVPSPHKVLEIRYPGLLTKKHLDEISSKLSEYSFTKIELTTKSSFLQNKVVFASSLSRLFWKWFTEIRLHHLIIGQRDFSNILNNCFNWTVLEFFNCKLAFEEVKITNKAKSNIISLSFNNSGRHKNSNWEERPDRLESLIRAISKWSIKESLQELILINCGLTRDEIIQIVEFYGIISIRLHV